MITHQKRANRKPIPVSGDQEGILWENHKKSQRHGKNLKQQENSCCTHHSAARSFDLSVNAARAAISDDFPKGTGRVGRTAKNEDEQTNFDACVQEMMFLSPHF